VPSEVVPLDAPLQKKKAKKSLGKNSALCFLGKSCFLSVTWKAEKTVRSHQFLPFDLTANAPFELLFGFDLKLLAGAGVYDVEEKVGNSKSLHTFI
jgi:hypothetical protein